MKNRNMFYHTFKAKNDKYHVLGSLVVIVILLLGVAFLCFAYSTQNSSTKQYLREVSVQAADRIRIRVEKDRDILEASAKSFAEMDDISDDKIEFLLRHEYDMYKDNSVIRLSYVELDGSGIEIYGDGYVKRFAIPPETGYFKAAIEKKQLISDITKDPISGSNAYVCAAPVIKNGKVVAVHHGVFMLSKINTILNINYFGDSGHSYIVEKDGTPVIGSGLGINGYSSLENDDFFRTTVERLKQGISRSSMDSMSVQYNEETYWMTYTPINLNDWYFVLVVPNRTINDSSDKVVIFSAAILLLMLITSIMFLRHMDMMQTKNQNELYELACIDEVTEIYNKTGFAEFLSEALKNNRDTRYAIAYFDLDNFKAYNDLFGYKEGDKLLRHTADVLVDGMEETECCARFNGDNFYMLVAYDTQTELEKRVTGIMEAISDFSETTDNSYDILSHCGIFMINDMHKDKEVDFYVDRVKIAVASANKAHKNEFIYYNDNMRKNLIFETELENDLKQSLENEDFKVYVQPKYDVQTQKLAGGEALIRWQHPSKGFLTPNRFVDIFEKNGQITEIDFYVLEQVCKMQQEWKNKGLEPIVVSVNQSRMHLFRNDYLDRLRAMIRRYDIDPGLIELEITETVALSNSQLLSQAVDDLHELGFRVSIDDFGSGQSSLNVLKDIEIDVIKLDRAFFISLTNSPKGKEIISTVIGMASRLNIETVSEGIETDEQFSFIKQAGCDLVQGFLFGKPMPIDEFSELFEKSRK